MLMDSLLCKLKNIEGKTMKFKCFRYYNRKIWWIKPKRYDG